MSLIRNNGEDRVMVFIDLRNVKKSAAQACPGPFSIDYCALTEGLVNNRRLVGAYIFDGKGVDDTGTPSEKFHKCCQHLGFRVIVRDSFDSEQREQKEVDVAMACEMMLHAIQDDYDIAIIVSGDRDFVPAVEHIQRFGKIVEVASFDNSRSKHLVRAADRYCDLGKMPIMIIDEPKDTGGAEPKTIELTSDESADTAPVVTEIESVEAI